MSRIGLIFLCLLGLVSCWSEPPPTIIRAQAQPEVIARGRELVKGLAACGVCHGETPNPSSILAGGRIITDEYGEVQATNITPSASGIGNWQDEDVIRAIRASIRPGGNWISADMHRGYEWMSDEDALAIVSYLRTLPPVDKELQRRELSFVDRNTKGFFDSRPEIRGYVPSIDPKNVVEYGQYLTDHVARCGGCHHSPASLLNAEQYLAGNRLVKTDLGEKIAPSITSSRIYGLGEWNEAMIVKYLKTGLVPDGSVTDPNFCPTGFFRNASDADLMAIARYLRTVPG
ncbi:MAG: cytochrome c [Deltaproteobacteria bacterium]|nr:cytochrome c [Deltaproteobacteria bacterium]